MQGIENFLAGLVLLQVQGDDVDALGGLGDFLQQATAELGSAIEDGHRVGGQCKSCATWAAGSV